MRITDRQKDRMVIREGQRKRKTETESEEKSNISRERLCKRKTKKDRE